MLFRRRVMRLLSPGHDHLVRWVQLRDGTWIRRTTVLRILTCPACREDWRVGSD